GAVPRRLASPRGLEAVWMAVGAASLAIRRPFEGAAITLAAGATLLPGACLHPKVSLAAIVRRVLAPAAVTLAVAGAWIAYYDYRVTGDPRGLPVMLHHRAYEGAPLIVCLAPSAEASDL